MENDEQKSANLIIKKDISSYSVFKFEYKEQNLNNNIEYQKWKELMIREYGNNSKQFKCNKDKILFYSTYIDCVDDPYYKIKCPICNNYICYFCLYQINNNYYFCCIKNAIFKGIFDFGPTSMNKPFNFIYLISLIPFINIFWMIIYYDFY